MLRIIIIAHITSISSKNMTMLQSTCPCSLQGSIKGDKLLHSTVEDRTRTLKRTESIRRSATESYSKNVIAPIIRTRIPHGFQQAYIASNRGENLKKIQPTPARRLPCRTRSCLSNGQLRSGDRHRDPAHQIKRTVSFGSIEGKFVENIAQSHKNSLWFSKEEFIAMRQEAILIADATKRVGPFDDFSEISSRGLEHFILSKESRSEFAKKSVLEHNDMAMYALASAGAVNKARQLAEMDAIEAHLIQRDIPSRRTMGNKEVSKRKLLNP